LIQFTWITQAYFKGPNAVSFANATAYCQGQGTALATIETQDEYDEAVTACDGSDCYIGAQDQQNGTAEGVYSWSDGTDIALDYGFNADRTATTGQGPWASGEPNEWKGYQEDCVEIRSSAGNKYNDVPCSGNKYPLCNGRYFRGTVALPFVNASIYCEVYGGKIASIPTEEDYNLAVAAANGENVWIGLQDDINGDPDMVWSWTDGTDIVLNYGFNSDRTATTGQGPWNNGEPNEYNGWEEDCVEMYTNGKYNDISCDDSNYPLCKVVIQETSDPTSNPTSDPTSDPTADPTIDPTTAPTADPTDDPTTDPTSNTSPDPTMDPTSDPTADPTNDPTSDPTSDPTADPTDDPTNDPTSDPTADPTEHPSLDPTTEPTTEPTIEPTIEPTVEPTSEPTLQPTNDPTSASCKGDHEQCGGQNYNGTTCCIQGYECISNNNTWYSQCEPITVNNCSNLWDQCGGLEWTGFTCCAPGFICVYQNDHYSQCLSPNRRLISQLAKNGPLWSINNGYNYITEKTMKYLKIISISLLGLSVAILFYYQYLFKK